MRCEKGRVCRKDTEYFPEPYLEPGTPVLQGQLSHPPFIILAKVNMSSCPGLGFSFENAGDDACLTEGRFLGNSVY